MHYLTDTVVQIFRTLWAHKLRSFLTMFGIAWGVGSLLLLVGLGEGFRSGNKKNFESLGEDVMFQFGGRVPPAPGSSLGQRPYWITYDDYLDIKREATLVRNVTPVMMRGDLRFVSQYATGSGSTTGVLPSFAQVRYMPMESGRWINQDDIDQRRYVAVIGSETRKVLFPGQPALGQTITINGLRFTIIGTQPQVGRGDAARFNSRIFIPFTTMQTHFPPLGENVPPNAISMMNYQPRVRSENQLAKAQVERIIARNHGFDASLEDAFEGWDTIQTAENVGKIFTAMNMFLGSVGIVTLGLGAVGIINIMLVSVQERTKEIGLRKALGATNRIILFQFFLEGIFLTLFSGGLGILGAAAFMAALGTLPSPPGFDTPKLVPWSAALAVACLSLAGVAAGLFPAKQAASLQPVEALRKD